MSLIRSLIRWATIAKAGDDDPTKFHIQQVEYMGKVADALVVFPYGLHGNVPPGAFGIMFSIQASPENRAVIAWTPKDRPQLKEGEVSFYHPPTDAFLTWKENGDLDIETGSGGTGDINIKSGNINISSGDINITSGDITVSGGDVDITATDVSISSPLTTITGALTVTGLANLNGGLNVGIGGNASVAGNMTVLGSTILGTNVTSNGVDISNTHAHPQGVDSNGDTQQNTGGPQ